MGTGNTATVKLTVAAPPTITASFSPAIIPVNGTSVLTFTITNPNPTTTLTGVGFTDVLPSGLRVATQAACIYLKRDICAKSRRHLHLSGERNAAAL